MYEACCQTFLAFIFIIAILHGTYNKSSFKEYILFWFRCIFLLELGICFNSLINKIILQILETNGIKRSNFANKFTIFNLIKSMINGDSIYGFDFLIMIYKKKFENIFAYESVITIEFFILIVIRIYNLFYKKY